MFPTSEIHAYEEKSIYPQPANICLTSTNEILELGVRFFQR